ISTIDSIASYLWDFGDGTTSTQRNPPAHNYNAVGRYNVSLTVTTEGGCVITQAVPDGILVGTMPTVSFTATPVDTCASEIISFTGIADTSPDAVVFWEWDFGDGTKSTQQNPTHKFSEFGNLQVKLTVTNNGCPNSFTQIVKIKPPIANFIPSVNCLDKSVTFTNTSRVDNTLTPLTYHWTMGDPAKTEYTTFVPPRPFNYPGTGTYNVRLIVVNGECADTTIKPVKIIAEQVADFTSPKTEVCKNEQFTFQATGSDPDLVKSYT